MRFYKISILLDSFIKLSYIRKVKNKYVVYSEKGKVLGKYDTKKEAEKRLQQIHFFKYKKAKKIDLSEADSLSLSGVLRLLRKKCTEEQVLYFLKKYHEKFMEALSNKKEFLQDQVLEESIKSVDTFSVSDILSNSREYMDDYRASIVEDHWSKSLSPPLPPYNSYLYKSDDNDEEYEETNQTDVKENHVPQIGSTEDYAMTYGLGPTQLRGMNSVE